MCHGTPGGPGKKVLTVRERILEAILMKQKLLSLIIFIVCLISAVSAGLFSVYRSEGKIISEEAAIRIEEFVNQFKGEQISE